MTVTAEKQALRKELLARRRSLSAEERDAMTRALTAQVLALPAYRDARRIMAYLSLPGEADLDEVIRAALGQGKEVYVPVCLADHAMEAGRLVDMDHFIPGPYGLRDLPKGYETAAPETMDLVLVPAVACDEMGRRLGHGAGYYDRYLSRVDGSRRLAVLWDFQIVPEVPADDLDLPMGGFVTEKRVHVCAGGKGVKC